MGPLTDQEMSQCLSSSAQVKQYATPVDRESARELLAKRAAADTAETDEEANVGARSAATAPRSGGRTPKPEPSAFEKVVNSPLTRTIAGVVARGIMGALLPKRRSTTTRRRTW
jgi:hypothetical protein